MTSYIIVSIISGILFGILDGLINANPIASKLYEVYKPIAKTSLNLVAGVIIDLAYGFILAAMFLLVYPSLPGEVGFVKGVSFALMVWFLRVVMSVASQWMMYVIPVRSLLYTILAGLGEMLVLGILYGLTLRVVSALAGLLLIVVMHFWVRRAFDVPTAIATSSSSSARPAAARTTTPAGASE